MPNVGKSTLFKALTKKQVDTANYPFCTIDPNVGVVAVPDERLEQLAKISKSAKIVPTTIEFVDIAGLVKDAHKGEGLGNKFLANIREVDAIAQVVRKFSDKNVVHVHNNIDPEQDRAVINLELIFADLQTVEKRHQSLTKLTHGQDKEAQKALAAIDKIKNALEKEQLASSVDLSEEEEKYVKELSLLTRKPMLYVLNVDEAEAKNNVPGYISISAKIEAELADLNEAEAKQYLKEFDLKESGLDKLIKAAYQALGLVTFLTTGPDETRAWTVKKGSKAPQAAGVIHSDFEKAFIRAEVIDWQKLLEAGSEAAAKEKGLMRIEGKDYIIQDGDVCNFRVNA